MRSHRFDYGHKRGDEVLVLLSDLLTSLTRDSDIVARWGGEEFLIVLYDSDAHSANAFCQRLHAQVKNIKVAENHALTLSIGGVEVKQTSTINAQFSFNLNSC